METWRLRIVSMKKNLIKLKIISKLSVYIVRLTLLLIKCYFNIFFLFSPRGKWELIMFFHAKLSVLKISPRENFNWMENCFKRNKQFVQTLTFEPLDFKQSHSQNLEILQKLLFKSFLHLKTDNYFFLWQSYLIFLTRKILTVDFWELHKNMNCVFPLT